MKKLSDLLILAITMDLQWVGGRGKYNVQHPPSGLFLAVKYIEGPVSFGSPIGSTDLASLPSNNGDL